MHHATAFIPEDRRAAIACNVGLPPRAHGSALFADISGFTLLTEAYAAALGPRQGADAATRQLNAIYGNLIHALHRYGGAVIGFSGDGMLCWFDDSTTCPISAASRAVLAASDLQARMQAHAAVEVTDSLVISLAIKTTIATGAVSRFVVGNPSIQCIDVLAGETVVRTASAEQLAAQGETLLDEATLAQVGPLAELVEWRQDTARRRFALVSQGTGEILTAAPDCVADINIRLPADRVRPWLLPDLYERLDNGQSSELGELRPATALFVRFGELDYDCNPAATAKLDEYIRWVQQILARYGGALIQLTTGDKGSYFFAAFGAPVAHDDNERRAAMAAHALSKPPSDYDDFPSIQAGIAQGRMRVGPYGGESRRAFGVQGSAVNLAARLMMIAKPGQIVVDPKAAALIDSSFHLEPLGERPVKGLIDALSLHALGDARRVNPIQGSVSQRPLVGRADELAFLHQTFDEVRAQGQGRIVRVVGDAGIGKSSLISAFVQQVKERGATVAAGAGSAIERNSAYAAIRPMARWLLGLGLLENTSPDAQIAHVRNLLKTFNPDWLLRLPVLGDLLGLPIADNAATATFEPQLRRQALIDLIIEIVQTVAKHTPLILLLEDAHWLDEASLEMTQAMARILRETPILVLLSHRSPRGEGEELVATLCELPNQDSLELEPLPSYQVGALLEQHLDGPIDSLAAALIERQTAGNPFFVDELASTMREGGDLQRRDDGVWTLSSSVHEALHRSRALIQTEEGWQLADRVALAEIAPGLPDSIHGTVLTRFDRLREQDRQTLRVASVIGRSFTPALLLSAHPTMVDEEVLAAQLARLRTLDFLVDSTASLGFKHTITQEVIYRSLLTEQRQEFHRHVGTALEIVSPQAVEQLARHFYHARRERSEDLSKALIYLDAAAERAQHDYANHAALHHLDRALSLEPSWQRWARRVEVLHVLGERKQEENALHRLSTIPETPPFRLAFAWAEYHEATSNYIEAVNQLQTALASARQRDDQTGEARCLARLGLIAWRHGDHATAEVRYQSALNLLDGSLQFQSEEAEARYGLGLVYRQQGRYDDARAQFETALENYQRQGNRQDEAKTLLAIGHIENYRHHIDLALGFYQKALELYRSTGDRSGFGSSLVSLAQGLRASGALDRARDLLHDALDIHEAIGDTWWQIIDWNELGIVAYMTGQFAEAERALQRGLRLSQEIGDEPGVAYTLCNLGQVYREWGNLNEAETLLRQGLVLSEQQEDRHLQANYLLDLALVQNAQGRYPEALDHATESKVLFEQLGIRDNATVLTTLALASLNLAQSDQASQFVDDSIQLLSKGTDFETVFPQREYMVCATIYQALGKTDRAKRCARTAHDLMMRQAARIEDPNMRRSFLENLQFNREIREQAHLHGAAESGP